MSRFPEDPKAREYARKAVIEQAVKKVQRHADRMNGVTASTIPQPRRTSPCSEQNRRCTCGHAASSHSIEDASCLAEQCECIGFSEAPDNDGWSAHATSQLSATTEGDC